MTSALPVGPYGSPWLHILPRKGNWVSSYWLWMFRIPKMAVEQLHLWMPKAPMSRLHHSLPWEATGLHNTHCSFVISSISTACGITPVPRRWASSHGRRFQRRKALKPVSNSFLLLLVRHLLLVAMHLFLVAKLSSPVEHCVFRDPMAGSAPHRTHPRRGTLSMS